MAGDRGLSGPHLARMLGAWRSARPGYVALAAAIRLLVLDGRLPLRPRLPGERDLAAALGVSRTTAAAAYAALRDEGFLTSRRGAGSWTSLPADRRAAPAASEAPPESDVIDLSVAATAAPEGALHRAPRRPRSNPLSPQRPPSSRATCPARAPTPWGCPRCGPRSRRGSASAA